MASTFHGGISFRLPKCDRRQIILPKTSLKLTRRLDECSLKTGDSIAGGDLLGTLNGHPVRSALSGKVTALASDETGISITLESDGEDRRSEALPFGKRTGRTLAEADRDELLAEIASSGIIEQSGEALIDHLVRASYYEGKLRLAAVCCFDLDPLCATNVSIVEANAVEVAGGFTILLKLLKLKDGTMLCDRRYKESVIAAEDACANSNLIAVEQTANRYPQANPRLITRLLMEKELSAVREPEDAGLFLTDAETCVMLYRHFAEGFAAPFKRVSIYTDGMLTLCDLPCGLALSELTALGLLPETDGDDCLCRGAMDGRRLPECVDATLSALAVLPAGNAQRGDLFTVHEASDERDGSDQANTASKSTAQTLIDSILSHSRGECISCGRCAEICPMFLLPYDYLPKSRLGALLSGSPRDAGACIGCGCCSYICPSGLPLRSAVWSASRKEHSNEK